MNLSHLQTLAENTWGSDHLEKEWPWYIGHFDWGSWWNMSQLCILSYMDHDQNIYLTKDWVEAGGQAIWKLLWWLYFVLLTYNKCETFSKMHIHGNYFCTVKSSCSNLKVFLKKSLDFLIHHFSTLFSAVLLCVMLPDTSESGSPNLAVILNGVGINSGYN